MADALKTTPSVSFMIQASLEGFPLTIDIQGGSADQLAGVIKRLKEIGAVPPAPLAPASPPPPAASGGAAPACRIHGPMKQKRDGGWWCTKKLHDGSYCQEVAS